MLYGLAKVCRKQQQVLLILSLIQGTNFVVFAEIFPLYQYMMYKCCQSYGNIKHQCINVAKVMATSSTNKPVVSTADGKCIQQKQEATLFVAEIKALLPKECMTHMVEMIHHWSSFFNKMTNSIVKNPRQPWSHSDQQNKLNFMIHKRYNNCLAHTCLTMSEPRARGAKCRCPFFRP